MTVENSDQDEWIDMDAARELTGKSRETLMRWKKDRAIDTRIEDAPFTQKQKRVFFRKADLLKEIGEEV